MSFSKRIVAVAVMFLLVSSTSIFCVDLSQVSAQPPMANLPGNIFDNGVDMDSDGTFDFLEISVEVNVTSPGAFVVEIYGLYDSTYNYIDVWGENYTYLDVGAQIVCISLDGPTIYASGFNPAIVSSITIYDEYYSYLDSLYDVPLSREYLYTEFDLPPASLTGVIYDNGVDVDMDGTFDFLEVGVEVNASTAGAFTVTVSGLYDSTYNYIHVWNETYTYLDVDINVVYLALDGLTIYELGFNPASVSYIYLYEDYYNPLGSLYDTPLSREYDYTEFDSPPPPSAFLTGNVTDGGVDIDGNGAFNYLEVGVEVNVSEAGQYAVQIWGLRDSNFSYLSVWGDTSGYFDVGVQVIDVSLYGPTIYSSGLDPVEISEIALYSVEGIPPIQMRQWLDSVYDVPLSREYLHTEFDSPFRDIEARFVVYPDGRVVMGGSLNHTHMEALNPISMHGVATLEERDGATDVSTSFTLIIPPEEASQFPFNSSDLTLLSEYSNGLLTTTVDGSTILPPSIASQLPFNITDFTVMGDYKGDLVEGNVTADMWNGFPLDDIIVDFKGNNTHVEANGSTIVIFGDYPGFGELNATILDHLLAELTNTLGGQGPESLYNMTDGLLEFTMLFNVTTPHNGNASVDFAAKIEGDLILALVYLTGEPADIYDLLNATWFSVGNASFLMTYSHALRQADLNLVFNSNMSSLIKNMMPILPDIMPSEEAAFIQSLLNNTYGIVDSAQISLDYGNGLATFAAATTIQDLNQNLNFVKSLFLNYSFSQLSTYQLQILNQTQLDLSSLSMSFNLTETSMQVTLDGFAVVPPLEWINATNFELESFFNLTAGDYEPPGTGERLKVTVEGGSNATHTVTVIRPGTVPEPDTSDPVGMIWYNQSISHLKDLVFQIGTRDTTSPVIGTPIQTPAIPDHGEAVTISVNVTDANPGVRPDGVILSYRADGGVWINVTMSKTTGDTYEGTIPGFPGGTYVEYMIIAYDYANNWEVQDQAGGYYVYTVITEFPKWQIAAVTILLAGIALVIIRRRQNVSPKSLSSSPFFSILLGTGAFS